jgi:hypothetical protein
MIFKNKQLLVLILVWQYCFHFSISIVVFENLTEKHLEVPRCIGVEYNKNEAVPLKVIKPVFLLHKFSPIVIIINNFIFVEM